MANREIGSFTPEQTRIIWDEVNRAMAAASLKNKKTPRVTDDYGAHRVLFKNETGEEIPAFACIEVFGMVEENERTFVRVRKVSTICGEYVFNSQFAVDPDGFGWAYAFGLIRMRGTASAFTACKRYGPTVGSWDVSEKPGPFLVYGEDNTTEGALRGRIVGDHCKAKVIQFDYTSGGSNTTVTPTEFWDGPNPASCGTVTVEYPLGEPCTDSPVLAFYDPNSDTYQAFSTPNAIQGVPETKTIMLGTGFGYSGCDIGYSTQSLKVMTCDSEPVPATTSPTLNTVTVVSSITDSGSGPIVIEYTDVYVCGFGGVFEDEIETTVCCSGNCTWTWSYASQLWTLTTPCSAGCDCGTAPADPVDAADPGSNGQTLDVPCALTV